MLLGSTVIASAVAATAGFTGGYVSSGHDTNTTGGELPAPENVGDAKTIGLLLFDGAWAADFPQDKYKPVSISLASRQVRCAQGLDVVAQHTYEAAPPIDVLLVPGGKGWRTLVDQPESIAKIQKLTERVELVASVCTGALLLAKAGFLKNRRATTHWSALDTLTQLDSTIIVDRNSRYVDGGNYVTSSGVSAGVDMALYVVSKLGGPSRANDVAHALQYTHQWQL
nr:DJ-1/PfpI family protein [Mycobacteroides abscessus]